MKWNEWMNVCQMLGSVHIYSFSSVVCLFICLSLSVIGKNNGFFLCFADFLFTVVVVVDYSKNLPLIIIIISIFRCVLFVNRFCFVLFCFTGCFFSFKTKRKYLIQFLNWWNCYCRQKKPEWIFVLPKFVSCIYRFIFKSIKCPNVVKFYEHLLCVLVCGSWISIVFFHTFFLLLN